MNTAAAIQTAQSAVDSALFLSTAAEISRAAKAWSRCEVLALDTEFVRERTFYANLGLVQLSDGHTVWLVDPLVEGATGPLKQLLETRTIPKIIHSPSEDLDVLWSAIGAVPEPMIDTQLACAMLGKPLQLGYHTAAEWLLEVAVAKDQTRSDWCARPLKQVQLRYAALDVCFLPLMWKKLELQLRELDRLDWFHEDCQRQLDKARVPADESTAWQRIRGNGRLDGVGLAILQALAAWREKTAKDRNRPRGFILSDQVLLNIAHGRPDSPESLSSIADFHPRAVESYGNKIIQTVQNIIASGSRLSEIKPLSRSQTGQLNELRKLVQAGANALGLDPALLASRRTLEDLLRNDLEALPEPLRGWREKVVAERLVHFLESQK